MRTFLLRIRHVRDRGATVREVVDDGGADLPFETVASTTSRDDTRRGVMARWCLEGMLRRGIARVVEVGKRRRGGGREG